MVSIDDLAMEAGLIEDEVKYLREKGIVSARHSTRAGAEDRDLTDKVIQPFTDGIDIEGTPHKASQCDDNSSTCLFVAYDLALERKQSGFAQEIRQSVAPQSGAAPPASTATLQQSKASIRNMADWDELKSAWEETVGS